ncbi:MAG: MBOAT family protein [Firmicutes bacterium]|nr:MBOAT family protein [Bacillota bacterium]
MLFNSIDFLIFFPIVTLIYFVIPRKARYIWLLVTSYFFYMCWDAKYALLLLASTAVTWLCGRLVYAARRPALKKLSLAACLCVNLGILFFFKYFDFFVENCNRVLGALHLQIMEKSFDVVLPVGISFYIFQALGYTIDVYRGKVEPEKNILRYALFVSFFPQLVAGPIERSESLLGQMRDLEKKKLWNYDNVAGGLTLMAWGLFVKMVIADRVALLVDNVFGSYYLHGTVVLAAAAVGFALQIYCDFMGYSTIAIGAARVMGFKLMENFETPYFSRSVSEFWKRWHISLSTWFRDYVYIPLGGNRCSKIRKYFNVMVTMTVSGLWHGANWTYMAWGMLHGAYQVIGDMTSRWRTRLYDGLHTKKESFSFHLAQVVSTFILTDIAWIFFRAPSLSHALRFCRRLVTRWDPWNLFNGKIYTLGLDRPEINILIVSLTVLFLVDLVRYKKKKDITVFLQEQCVWFRWGVIIALIAATLVFGIYGIEFESSRFIYFQF